MVYVVIRLLIQAEHDDNSSRRLEPDFGVA